ncbi:MAG TPA: DNA ligase D [Silvibacterium sp.]|nr:DNA ligase D [Silvibacterium sp.]
MAKKAPAKKSGSAAKEVEKQLERYRAMRDFAMTAEPSGGEARKGRAKQESTLPFVIQKHAATRLHYDFRLGWRGVLKSWAVAKGPSYFPGDKRLAVEVEDHPISYGGFEGTIPKGQYGGGTVMVWDQGTWEPHVDMDEGLRTGRLKFGLNGEKLKGNWALVRMGGHAARESKPNWLLIKEHDEYERGANDEPITEEAPDSVVTGRDLDAIAKAEDHVWQSNKAAAAGPNRSRLTLRRKQASEGGKPATAANDKQAAAPDRSPVLKGTAREAMPRFVSPQLATGVNAPPEADGWLHELKLDGYRIQAHVSEQKRGARKVVLYSRNGLDWTHRMPDVAHELAKIPVKAAVLDGEVVVLDEKGSTSFAELQAAFEEGKQARMTYFVFDLLHLDGHNLRILPLTRRKEILKGLIEEAGGQQTIQYSEHIRDEGAAMFSKACQLGAEGVISKPAKGKYISGRSKEWLKSKCVHQQEFVVGGFTLPSDGGQGIGALLLGYHNDGKLVYAGRTGTGFTQASRAHLRKELDKLRTAKTAFSDVPQDASRDAIWVKPTLVAEVNFASWTGGGMVRQASFQGIREDKAAKDVVREEPRSMAKPQKRSAKHAEPPRSAPPVKSSRDSDEVDGVRLTHPDKILDDETQLTKLQLASYYSAVSRVMLPHIVGRPLSIVRCPEGSGKPCFFQKHIGSGLPAGVESVPVKGKNSGAVEQYITMGDTKGLIGLAQMGVLEVHPWSSRNNALETPDQLIFDLDPDTGIEWKQLVTSAFEVRDLLTQLGLESFVKSTGGKGLHIVAPIKPQREWPEVKAFAHSFVRMMESANPKLYLTKMTKAARKNRIYLDYLRNERGATAVAPYSPRARKGVHVAVPLGWNELKRIGRPEFAVASFESWKARLKHDPWAKMESVRQSLTAQAVKAVDEFAA